MTVLILIFCCVCGSLFAQNLIGDVNSDGAVTVADAILLSQYVIGFNPTINSINSDVNNSWSLTMLDALYIAQFAEGLIVEMPTVVPTVASTAIPSAAPTMPPTPDPNCVQCAEITVYGYVTNAGSPVQGAHVLVGAKIVSTTDSGGYYSFITAGTCWPTASVSFRISAPGYYPLNCTSPATACGSVRRDVELQYQYVVGSYPGDMWIEPFEQTVVKTKPFVTTIWVDSRAQKLAAYHLSVTYDSTMLASTADVAVLANGFNTCVNANTAGKYSLVGIDVYGKGAETKTDFIASSWIATNPGISVMDIQIKELEDAAGSTVGNRRSFTSFVRVVDYGDANTDGKVDIVDALLVSKYFIGLNPPGFFADAADVNASGAADIIDALLIAQYYVGIISKFPAEP
jgi:hypothetical protein